MEVLPVDGRPSEPDGFRDFVEAWSNALLRSGWLLTGDGLLGGGGEGPRVEGAGPPAGRARTGRAHDRRGGVVNTEERQLAEMLHQVTPEPPRRVTVEDVASRLASEAGQGRGGYREPRPR